MRRRSAFFEQRFSDLQNDIREAIMDGRLKPGDYTLPENTLSERYDLSRFSVRNALAQLVKDGYIEKVPGIGNRVRARETKRVTETICLSWFDSSHELPIIKEILRLFESRNPHIRVNLMTLPEGDYVGFLNQLLELGSGPDVFHVSDSHIRALEQFGKLGMLKLFGREERDVLENSYLAVFDMFTIRGELRAMPFAFSPVAAVCNEKLWAESGVDPDRKLENWSDLLEIALQCTKQGQDGMVEQYGFCFSTMMLRWQLFVLQNEGQLVSHEHNQLTFTHERVVEALEFCVDLIYKHKVSPMFSEGVPRFAEKMFAEGNAAMILTTYYYMNQFRNRQLQWKVLPAFGQRKKGALLMGSGIAVNNSGSNVPLAEQLVDFMTGLEAQTLLKKNGCTIPMLKSVAEDDSLLNPEIHPYNYNMFREILPFAATLWDMGLKPLQLVQMSNELHYAWAGIKKPQQVCERIDELFRI